MKRFFCKILPCILGTLVLIFVAVCVYVYFSIPVTFQPQNIPKFVPQPAKSPDFVLTPEQVKADVEELISLTEETHPLFLNKLCEFLTEFPPQYETAKANLLAMCNTSATVGELQYEMSKYLSSLNDAHSLILDMTTVQLDIDWEWMDGKLYLLDENGKLTDKEIVSVGNIPINDIIEEANLVFPSENEIGKEYNAKLYAKSKVILQHFGINSSAGTTVEYLENNQIKQMECTYTQFQSGVEGKRTFTKLIDNDIAYISFQDFLYSRTSFSEFENILVDVEKYKADGVKHYIVDLTDNEGGYSLAAKQLDAALGIEKAPLYTVNIRFSPLAKERYGYIRSNGSMSVKRGNSKVVRDENLHIYILTDEETFSMAQKFTVNLSDAGVATVIGRPSRQGTSFYGNPAEFQLQNSRIYGRITTDVTIRNNKDKIHEPILQPDVYVNKTEDIVQTAVDYIRKQSK